MRIEINFSQPVTPAHSRSLQDLEGSFRSTGFSPLLVDSPAEPGSKGIDVHTAIILASIAVSSVEIVLHLITAWAHKNALTFSIQKASGEIIAIDNVKPNDLEEISVKLSNITDDVELVIKVRDNI